MIDATEAAQRILAAKENLFNRFLVKPDDDAVVARAYLDLEKRARSDAVYSTGLANESHVRAEKAEAVMAELVAALKAAQEHLDYTGYGDIWERSCAKESKLEERINAVLAKHTKQVI